MSGAGSWGAGGGGMPAWARETLAPLPSAARGATGVAVAARRGTERVFLTTGCTAREGGKPVDADTRFEIGSLSKAFTALLLAESVARGETAYGDPVARFLPPGGAPCSAVPVTLLHLATHTSGLPRLPPGLLRSSVPRFFSNPYAAFTSEDLLRVTARARLRSRPGTRVAYSNFGAGLLGHLLARASGGDYATLLAERVLGPLGLRHTDCGPGSQGPPGRAPGADAATGYRHGRARPPWEIPGLPGAGAVRAGAGDLLTLLEALLDPGTVPEQTPGTLRAALADAVRPRVALRGGAKQLALIWNISPRAGHAVYHHSGGTRGFTAFAGFSPGPGTALVALANSSPALSGRFIQGAYGALRALGG